MTLDMSCHPINIDDSILYDHDLKTILPFGFSAKDLDYLYPEEIDKNMIPIKFYKNDGTTQENTMAFSAYYSDEDPLKKHKYVSGEQFGKQIFCPHDMGDINCKCYEPESDKEEEEIVYEDKPFGEYERSRNADVIIKSYCHLKEENTLHEVLFVKIYHTMFIRKIGDHFICSMTFPEQNTEIETELYAHSQMAPGYKYEKG